MNELKVTRYTIGNTYWEIIKDRTEDCWYLENLETEMLSTVNGELIRIPQYITPSYLELYRFKTPEDALKIYETKIKK